MKDGFKKGSGCFKCEVCGKLTRNTGQGLDVKYCQACYDKMEVEE